MRSFEIALKKGELGEKIVKEYLESLGWIVYMPFTKNKAHAFDILATREKKEVIALDVKTKAKFNNWDAQGINRKSYEEYRNFKRMMEIQFFLYFVCDKSGDVYCFEIGKEMKSFSPTPYIIAWYLSDMDFLFNIGEENIKLLSQFDQRSYEFKPQTKLL
jgi:Holliday junction resolvase-like predicted endonuclease